MRTLQRMGAGLLALTLAGGIAACGSDDGDSADPTTTTGAPADGDLESFCASILELNTAVGGIEIDETTPADEVTAAGETLAGPLEDLLATAPADLVAPAEELNSFIEPMVAGDAEAFNGDDAFATYSAFLTDAAAACPFAPVPVTAVDYAFEDVPETIPAGTTAFSLTNASTGTEDHEMIVMRKADGVTLSFDELLELSEEESADKVEFVGAGFAPNGGDPGTVLAELTPGAYVMLCFIPVGGADDGPPHFTQGMKQEFTVE